ncbi:MAG: hypothetical protein HWE14_06390 [Flavobacteriia bacterium]|nr:hypothetical protein [Flavobacteriia bacterium]
MRIFKIVVVVLAFTLVSCEDYFGEKTDLDFIEVPEFSTRDIAYVPIQPALTDFGRPVSIVAGFDELIYVADELTEEIICLDESGREQGRFSVPGLKFVTQDRSFDLLAIGTKDTVVNGTAYSLSAIYRIDQLGNSGYGLDHAEIVNTIVHPFYFKSSFSSTDAQVTFNGIAVMGDNVNPTRNNQYYVTRQGPSPNNANQGPDDAVIIFSNDDDYLSPISVQTSSGLFNDYFKDPFDISTLTKAPQFSASNSPDFFYTSRDPNNLLKVQRIEFVESDFGAEYRPVIYGPDPVSDGYLNEPGKFTDPMGVTVAGDESRYIFVSDAASDSIYQFTANGLEGVPPPPASGETKYAISSFGGTGIGLTNFNEPRGLAYYNEILYVCDAGNGRVLRFKLTLDFD